MTASPPNWCEFRKADLFRSPGSRLARYGAAGEQGFGFDAVMTLAGQEDETGEIAKRVAKGGIAVTGTLRP